MPADTLFVGSSPRFVMVLRDDNKVIDDLAAATTLEVIFKRPDGTRVVRGAVLDTDGKDGRVAYDIDPALDLTVPGNWEIQGRVVFGPRPYFSEIKRFYVNPAL